MGNINFIQLFFITSYYIETLHIRTTILKYTNRTHITFSLFARERSKINNCSPIPLSIKPRLCWCNIAISQCQFYNGRYLFRSTTFDATVGNQTNVSYFMGFVTSRGSTLTDGLTIIFEPLLCTDPFVFPFITSPLPTIHSFGRKFGCQVAAGATLQVHNYFVGCFYSCLRRFWETIAGLYKLVAQLTRSREEKVNLLHKNIFFDCLTHHLVVLFFCHFFFLKIFSGRGSFACDAEPECLAQWWVCLKIKRRMK